MVKKILLLGDPKLYEKSSPVSHEELEYLKPVITDLHDTLLDFRSNYGAGRAIAAPQIGVFKRLIYMYIDKPTIFINPTLHFPNEETMEIIDDCMSFPHLLVKVRRYKECKINYIDETGTPQSAFYEGDLSELIQHEYDHLDGILATMRAVNQYAFYAK